MVGFGVRRVRQGDADKTNSRLLSKYARLNRSVKVNSRRRLSLTV